MDHKETQASSYSLKLSDLTIGLVRVRGKGAQFGMQVRYLDANERELGNYMVIETSLFDAMVKELHRD